MRQTPGPSVLILLPLFRVVRLVQALLTKPKNVVHQIKLAFRSLSE